MFLKEIDRRIFKSVHETPYISPRTITFSISQLYTPTYNFVLVMPNPDIVYSTDSYCSLCDFYFPSLEARAEHVDISSNHPRCDTCDRRFLNKNILRNVCLSYPSVP